MASSGLQFFLVTFRPILCCKGCMNIATDIFKAEEIADSNLAKSEFEPCQAAAEARHAIAEINENLGDE